MTSKKSRYHEKTVHDDTEDEPDDVEISAAVVGGAAVGMKSSRQALVVGLYSYLSCDVGLIAHLCIPGFRCFAVENQWWRICVGSGEAGRMGID